MSELVERVDEQDRVVGVVDRSEAIRRGWLHRIAVTICRDGAGRILVLRRPDALSRFPGHYDAVVGGGVDVGESYERAAMRELREELGVRVPVRFVFKFLFKAGAVWLGVHDAVVTGPVVPDPEEIAWHGWWTEDKLSEEMGQLLFVPGGRAALHRYLESGPGS